MSQATSPPTTMIDSRNYTIVRVFNPETFSIEWDLLLATADGFVQLSRFDGVLDYNQGSLGEGKYFDWEFVLQSKPQKPGDGTGSGMVHLSQEFGAKLKFEPETVAKKLDEQWYAPVLKKDGKDVMVQLDNLSLPPTKLRESNADAVLDSKVDEGRIVLDSVYGPLSLGYYDGLVSHVTGEMLPVTIHPFISDEYEVLVKVKSDRPGIVQTLSPVELLYLLETAQYSLYLDDDNGSNSRTHLLADGREIVEPANASPW